MIGIVIVAHGGLAREYLAAMEHVVGKQTGIKSVAIDSDCNREAKQAEIHTTATEVDTGDGVVIVTDMFGSTPSNLAIAACKDTNRKVIYGANLPLLIKLVKARKMPLSDAVNKAIDAGHKYLNCANQIIA